MKSTLLLLAFAALIAGCTLTTPTGDWAGDTADLVSDGTDQQSDDPCENYCNRLESTCTGEWSKLGENAMSDCRSACEAFDDPVEGQTYLNDTLECRDAYLTMANANLEYCEAAIPTMAVACNDEAGAACEALCMVAKLECAGTYTDDQACLSTCNLASEAQVICSLEAALSSNCAQAVPNICVVN